MADPVMENPLAPSPRAQMHKTVADVHECVIELKREYFDAEIPITDDSKHLQRFFVKFEHLLQAGLKVKTGLLGGKKDYWHYFLDCQSSNKGLGDAVKFVKSLSELRTPLGKGRAFLRFCLVHQRLADTIQQCACDGKVTSDWYMPRAVWLQHELSSKLISSLYDLNDIQFDLSARGYDLDSSWPTFARKQFGSWRPPSRSTSISSLASISTQDLNASLSMASSPIPDLHVDQMRKDLSDVEAEKMDLSQQVDYLERERQDIMSKNKDLEEQIQDLQQRENEYQVRINTAQKELAIREESWKEKEGEYQSKLSEADGKIDELQKRLHETSLGNKDQLEGYVTESVGLKVRLQASEDLCVAQKKQVEQLLREIELGKQVDTKRCEIVKMLEQTIAELKQNIEVLTDKNISLQQDKESSLKKHIENANKVNELCNQMEIKDTVIAKLKETNGKLQEMSDFAQIKGAQIASTAKEKVIQYKEMNAQLQSKIENLEQTCEEHVRNIAAVTEQFAQMKDTHIEKSVHEETLLELEKNFQEVKSLLAQKEIEFDNLKKSQESVLDNVQEKVKELSTLQEAYDNVKVRHDTAEKEHETALLEKQEYISELEKKVKKMENENERLASEQRGTEDKLVAEKKSRLEVEGQVTLMKSQQNESEKLYVMMEEKVGKREEEIAHLETEITGLKKILSQLETVDAATLNSEEGKDNPLVGKVKAVMQEKKFLENQLRHEEAQAIQLRKQVEAGEQQVMEITAELTHSHLEAAELKTLISQNEMEAADLGSKVEVLKIDLENKTKELEQKENEEEMLQKTVSNLTGEVKQLHQIIAERDDTIESTAGSNERLTEELMEVKERQGELSTQNTKLKMEIGTIKENLEQSQVALSEAQNLVQTLQGEMLNEKAEKSVLSDKLEKSIKEQHDLREEFVSKEQRLQEDHHSQLTDIQEKLQEEIRSKSAVANELESQRALFGELERELNRRDELKVKSDNTLKETEVKFQEDIQKLEMENKQLVLDKDKLQDELKALMTTVTAAVEERDSLKTSMADQESQISTLTKDKEELQEINQTCSEQISTLKNDLASVKSEVVIKEVEAKELATSLESLKEEKVKSEAELLEAQTRCNELNVDLQKIKRESERATATLHQSSDEVRSKLADVENDRDTLAAQATSLQEDLEKIKSLRALDLEEKSDLVINLQKLKAAQEAEMEEKQLVEHKLMELSQKLDSCKDAYETEVSALKFKLSSEQMAHKNAIKTYSNQRTDLDALTQKLNDQEGLIESLEEELQELRGQRAQEQQELWRELEELRQSLSQREEECTLLHDELKRNKSVLHEERDLVIKYKNKLTKNVTDHQEIMKVKDKELVEHKEDITNLKKKLIQLLKEKDSLWQKTDQLEHWQRLKLEGKWMEDKEVQNCLSCAAEFSFRLRKHHCRLCGRIFCYNCCNNWLETPHSSKKERACNECAGRKSSGQVSESPSDDTDDDTLPQRQTRNNHRDGLLSEESTAETDVPPGQPPGGSTNHQAGGASSLINETDEYKAEVLRGAQAVTDRGSDVVRGDETFDVITPDEVSKSVHECSVVNDPNLQGSITYTVDQIMKKGVAEPEGELWIRAGKLYAVVVQISQQGLTLDWAFATESKGISFCALYRSLNADTTQSEQLIPLCKCSSHKEKVRGQFQARKPGLYTLLFDNTASRMMSKKLTYELKILQ